MSEHVRPIPFNERFTCSVAEAEQATSLSQKTIARMIARGELESVMVGGRRLVLIESLRQVINGRRMTRTDTFISSGDAA
jgi:excisionase family DNA binding protein